MELDREKMLQGLGELDRRLGAENSKAEICLFGGAVMVLEFKARPTTHDMDVVFKPQGIVRKCVLELQKDDPSFYRGWFNDGVKGYTGPHSEKGIEEASFLPIFQNLKIYSATPEYLLAMKVMASRQPSLEKPAGDLEDIRFLLKHLKIESPEKVFQIVEKYFEPQNILPKSKYVVEGICQELKNEKDPTKLPEEPKISKGEQRLRKRGISRPEDYPRGREQDHGPELER